MSYLDKDRREYFRNLYYPERVRHLDVGKWVDYSADAGATSVCMDIKSQAYVYYDSVLVAKDPVLGSRDLAAELSAAARRRGLKWSAYIAPNELECLTEEQRRDWHIRFEDGESTIAWKGRRIPERAVFCWNSPYTELFLSILEEIATKYHPDGFYLDGVAFPCACEKIACYCKYCRDRFNKEYGIQLPTVDKLDSNAWPIFLQARRRWNAEVAEKIKKRVHAVDPEISLVTNAIFGFHGWTCSMNPEAAKHFDFLCFEIPPGLLHQDQRPFGFSVGDNFLWKSAILRGVQKGRPGEYFTVFETKNRTEEIKFGVDLVNAVGARLSIAGKRADTAETMARIKEMEPYLVNLTPAPQLAIHFSENTHIAYHKSHISVRDPDDTVERDPFFNELRGVFKIALDARRPVELLMDEDMSNCNFRGARLLVLPNSAVLPVGFDNVLSDFLKKGGSAIATMETGTLDESGNKLTDELIFKGSGLKMLEPIKTRKPWILSRKDGNMQFEEPVPAVPAQYLCFKKGEIAEWLGEEIAIHHRNLPEPIEEREIHQLRNDENSVHLPFNAIRITADERWKVLATIKYLDDKSGEWLETPGILSRPVGDGMLIYAAFTLSMGKFCYSWYRQLVMHLYDMAIGPNPIRFDAPACVKVTFWKQGGKSLIHLVNELSDQPAELEIENRIPVPVKLFIPHSEGRIVEIPVGGHACSIDKTPTGLNVSNPALRDRMLLVIS
jgi:hypothetical protein